MVPSDPLPDPETDMLIPHPEDDRLSRCEKGEGRSTPDRKAENASRAAGLTLLWIPPERKSDFRLSRWWRISGGWSLAC